MTKGLAAPSSALPFAGQSGEDTGQRSGLSPASAAPGAAALPPAAREAGDRARKTLFSGLFFGLWAAAGWLSIRGNPQIAGVDFGADPGPGLLPAIVLTILSLGALALVLVGFAGLRQARPSPVCWSDELRALIGPALLCLALALYLPLVRGLGFILGTVLFSAAVMAGQRLPQLRQGFGREALSILIGVIVCTGLTWALFIYWIGVALG